MSAPPATADSQSGPARRGLRKIIRACLNEALASSEMPQSWSHPWPDLVCPSHRLLTMRMRLASTAPTVSRCSRIARYTTMAGARRGPRFCGPSFAEAGVPFDQLSLTEDKLHELDATGWELHNLGSGVIKAVLFCDLIWF
jgi:hypothetical protein